MKGHELCGNVHEWDGMLASMFTQKQADQCILKYIRSLSCHLDRFKLPAHRIALGLVLLSTDKVNTKEMKWLGVTEADDAFKIWNTPHLLSMYHRHDPATHVLVMVFFKYGTGDHEFSRGGTIIPRVGRTFNEHEIVHVNVDDNEADSRKCETCGAAASMRCGNCKQTYYCRVEHQLEDWGKHKKQCQKR